MNAVQIDDSVSRRTTTIQQPNQTFTIIPVGAEAAQYTQTYYAEKFNRATRDTWLFNVDSGKWMFWNGKYWETDDRNTIFNVCRVFLINQLRDIRAAETDSKINATIRILSRLNTRQGISDVLNIAKSMVTKKENDFDLQKSIINVQNGTYDLKTGVLSPHSPGDFISKCCGCRYDPDARCPEWTRHITTTFDNDSELISSVQEILGYSLFAGNPAAIFGIFVGSGRNGKSVTIDTIQRVLGTYSVSVNPNCLMDNGGNPGSDRLKMIGARMIVASEPGDTSKGRCSLDTGFIKTITGGDRISARRLYCESIDFSIDGLVVLITNVLPQIRDHSVAMRERVWCVPFDHYFSPEERDTAIRDTLFGEAPGILNWLIEGFRRYAERGRLVQSQKVTQQSEWYMDEEDDYSQFLSESGIVRKPGLSISGTDLYRCYLLWCNSVSPNGAVRSARNTTAFGRHMSTRFRKSHTRDGVVYHDVGFVGQGKIA